MPVSAMRRAFALTGLGCRPVGDRLAFQFDEFIRLGKNRQETAAA